MIWFFLLNIDVRTTAHTRIKQRKLIADRARQSVGKDKTPMPPPQQQPPHKRRHIRKAIALVPCIQRAQHASGTCKGFWTIAAPCQTKASSCGNAFCRQISLTDLHSAALWQHLFTANNSCCKPAPCGFFADDIPPVYVPPPRDKLVPHRRFGTKKRTCTGCRFFCAKYSEANLRNNVCLLYIILNFCVPYVWSAHRLHCRTFILPLYPARLSPALSTVD